MTERLRGGRFTRLEPLGEGSQGRTYAGLDEQSGRAVAIKQFDVRHARAWKDVELAEREARVLAALSHPKLPAYVDHFEEDGTLYLVMEKIEGESLASLRKRSVSFSEEDVLRFLRDASEILDYLHGRAPQVIHRDLKPGNVIRRPDGSFAFVDFGAVREKLRPDGGSTVVGTFGFMAPEQFQGRAGPGSDVYAVGATALCMLTGQDPETLPHKGLGIDVRAALRGRATDSLSAILEQMLAPDPDQRATRMAPLLEEIERRTRGRREARTKREPPPRDERDFEQVMEQMGRDLERRIEEETRDFERRVHAVHQTRKERHQSRRATRRDERAARRRRGGEKPWPWIFALFATLGLTVAILAVSIVLQVVIPTLFTLLSWIISRRLQGAGETVKRAGAVAVAAMRRARDHVQHGIAPPRAEEQPQARVAAPDASVGARVRVAQPTHEPLSESEAEEAAHDEEREAGDERRRRK